MAEIRKTTVKLCRSCKYCQRTGDAGATLGTTCGYLVMTGRMRGCSVGECDKYEAKGKKRSRVALKL